MTCGIYKITNQTKTEDFNRCYIGQSKNIELRWSRHRTKPFNPTSNDYDSPLYRAFRKYGIENFIFEVIEECKVEELNQKEIYWIQYYESLISFKGYNLTLGGSSSPGVSLDITLVKEISEILKSTTLTNREIANKFNVSENTISGINTGYYWKRDIDYPIREHKKHICVDCGASIGYGSTRCVSCSAKIRQKTNRPDKDILLQLVATEGFSSTGRKYGVSDKAIAKWCASYGLPTRIKELKELYKSTK